MVQHYCSFSLETLSRLKWIKTEQRHTQKFKRVYFPIEKKAGSIFLCARKISALGEMIRQRKRVEKASRKIFGASVFAEILKVCALNPAERRL